MNLRRRERKTGAVEVSPEESLTPSSAAVVVPVAAPAYAAPVEHQVPEWFKKGQEQAKKPAKEKPVQRSRYATALERAEEEINAREEHERRNLDELSERMRVMRASVQAASAAAGATPTEIMDSVVADESSEEISAPPSASAVNEEASPSLAPVLPAIEVPAVEAINCRLLLTTRSPRCWPTFPPSHPSRPLRKRGRLPRSLSCLLYRLRLLCPSRRMTPM